MDNLPRITVVTPSFNQGEFIEDTINSVLSQRYPNLDYIIMDGGSTDDTVNIIKKYEKYLSFWRSEPDSGQSDAIQKGFQQGTGQILAWLNSDDMYSEGTLLKIGNLFNNNPNLHLVYGDYTLIYPNGKKMLRNKISYDFNICLYYYMMVAQPSSFWTKSIYQKVGGLDPIWQYVMDYDLFLRIGNECKNDPANILHIKESLSYFRVHKTSKSVNESMKFKPEQKLLKSRWISESRFKYKLKQRYYALKTAWKFLIETHSIPLRKPPGKY